MSLISLRHRLVPPVAGLCTTDPEFDLDVVQDKPRDGAPGYVLSSSFGFGGANTALVLVAWGSAS